jgi:hypothetical protein
VHRDASEDFLEGFNEADPLVNIISVGSGKEAADAKLRGKLVYYNVIVEHLHPLITGIAWYRGHTISP